MPCIEMVEGTGLWLARRWGEYFAMIATSLGLPLEIYDLTRKVTATALVLFAINLALVLYLVITKRLFGIRGGKKAYDARLRSESVLEAARRAADAVTAAPEALDGRSHDPGQHAAQTPDAAALGQSPVYNSAVAAQPRSRPRPCGRPRPDTRPRSGPRPDTRPRTGSSSRGTAVKLRRGTRADYGAS